MATTMRMDQPSVLRQATTFGRHFLEMCLAMCIVGTPIVLAIFRWAPAYFGVTSPAETAPDVSLLVVAVIYAAPMVGWMRYRGMAWRPVAEMALMTIVVAIALILLKAIGILAPADFTAYIGPKLCGPACAAMVVAMLPRLSLYTGRDGHHMHHGMASA